MAKQLTDRQVSRLANVFSAGILRFTEFDGCVFDEEGGTDDEVMALIQIQTEIQRRAKEVLANVPDMDRLQFIRRALKSN